MKFLNSLKKDKIKLAWFILLVISFFGIIFNLVATMIEPGNSVPPLERGGDQERSIWPLYFTTQSNILVVIVSFISVFVSSIKKDNKIFKAFKVMMVVNITLTMFVYFGILFPASLKKTDDGRGILSLLSTLCVHFITPVTAITIFTLDSLKVKHIEKTKYVKTTALNCIYPIVWLVIGIIYYYAMGGERQDAIYGFLNFNGGAMWPCIYIFGIAAGYIGLTTLAIYIQNKRVK